MTSKKDWALYWAERGYHVFPVHGKTPYSLKDIGSWPRTATTDPAAVARWWGRWPDANIGCHVGASGHLVFDLDVKGGRNGLENWRRLSSCVDAMPETMETETPSGGRHVWFLADERPNSTQKMADGVDTKGDAGFVLMPGSTYNGREYRILQDTDPAPIPPALQEAAVAAASRGDRMEAKEGVVLDDPANVERAREWLSRREPAIEGAGGDAHTYATACQLSDFGLTQDTAFDLLSEWNLTCVPPWDDGDLRAKLENAYAYAQNAPGSRAMATDGSAFAALAASVPAAPAPEKRSRFRVLDVAELKTLPEPSFLIPEWVPDRAVTMLYGPPGSYKSFLALDMALSVAAGVSAMGANAAPEQGPAVYCAGEGQFGIARQRVPAWLDFNHVFDTPPFLFVPSVPLASGGAQELADLRDAIMERADAAPRLVVVDTHFRAMLGLDENSAQDTGRAVDLYSNLSRVFGCAVLAIHHTDKAKTSERGSGAFRAGVDTVLRMERDDATKVSVLTCEKMKDAPEPLPVAFKARKSGESIVLERKGEALQDRAASELALEVRRILQTNGAIADLGRAMKVEAVAGQLERVTQSENLATARDNAARILRDQIKKDRDLRAMTAGPGLFLLPGGKD